MITIIKLIQQHVTGAEMILLGFLLCIGFFILVFMLFKANRNKKAITVYIIILFLLFEVFDIIWYLYFFPKGEYVNRGLASIHIFLIFPLLGLILNSIITVLNTNKARTPSK